MREPTSSGRILWSSSNGWLDLIPPAADDATRVPCTCGDRCLEADCRGLCGCEACTLAWLVHQDERALWDEAGRLVAPETLEGPWQRIGNPDQLTLRFQFHSAENRHG